MIAPGTVLGRLQVALGAALATVAPSAQIVPAATAVMASLVIGRLNILLTSRFLIEESAFAFGEASQGYDWRAEPESRISIDFPEFCLSFLSKALGLGLGALSMSSGRPVPQLMQSVTRVTNKNDNARIGIVKQSPSVGRSQRAGRGRGGQHDKVRSDRRG